MDPNNAAQTPAPKSNTMTMALIGGLLLLAVGGGAWYFLSQNNTQTTNQTAQTPTQAQTQQTPAGNEAMTADETTVTEGEVKEFDVAGQNFKFTPSEIRVKKGDTVKINFTSSSGFHDFVLDEFNAKTKQLQAGQSETIEFVASEAGTFEYYCSVGNHRAMGMVGTLIVE